LSAIIDRWDRLPEAMRDGIAAMVLAASESARPKSADRDEPPAVNNAIPFATSRHN
jgi:hypothetical protein